MDTKIIKSLRNLNRFIDDDYQKLCDCYHNLELSHNRKKKALIGLRDCFIECLNSGVNNVEIVSVKLSRNDVRSLIKVCDDALFCDGRQNCPPLVQHKKVKGEKR